MAPGHLHGVVAKDVLDGPRDCDPWRTVEPGCGIVGSVSTPAWFQRLGPGDVQALATDVGPVPMNVGAVLLLDSGTDFDPAGARQLLETRLAAIPRLRQRLVDSPLRGWPPDLGGRPEVRRGRSRGARPMSSARGPRCPPGHRGEVRHQPSRPVAAAVAGGAGHRPRRRLGCHRLRPPPRRGRWHRRSRSPGRPGRRGGDRAPNGSASTSPDLDPRRRQLLTDARQARLHSVRRIPSGHGHPSGPPWPSWASTGPIPRRGSSLNRADRCTSPGDDSRGGAGGDPGCCACPRGHRERRDARRGQRRPGHAPGSIAGSAHPPWSSPSRSRPGHGQRQPTSATRPA